MRATCPHTQRGTRARTAAARGPRRRRQTPSGRSGTPTTCTDRLRRRTWTSEASSPLSSSGPCLPAQAGIHRRRRKLVADGARRSARWRRGPPRKWARRGAPPGSPRSRTRRWRQPPVGAPPEIGGVWARVSCGSRGNFGERKRSVWLEYHVLESKIIVVGTYSWEKGLVWWSCIVRFRIRVSGVDFDLIRRKKIEIFFACYSTWNVEFLLLGSCLATCEVGNGKVGRGLDLGSLMIKMKQNPCYNLSNLISLNLNYKIYNKNCHHDMFSSD